MSYHLLPLEGEELLDTSTITESTQSLDPSFTCSLWTEEMSFDSNRTALPDESAGSRGQAQPNSPYQESSRGQMEEMEPDEEKSYFGSGVYLKSAPVLHTDLPTESKKRRKRGHEEIVGRTDSKNDVELADMMKQVGDVKDPEEFVGSEEHRFSQAQAMYGAILLLQKAQEEQNNPIFDQYAERLKNNLKAMLRLFLQSTWLVAKRGTTDG